MAKLEWWGLAFDAASFRSGTSYTLQRTTGLHISVRIDYANGRPHDDGWYDPI